MNRRRLLLIGATALLIGSFSSYIVFRSLQSKMSRAVPGVSVVVAAHDLLPGEVLAEHDLKVKIYPTDFLPEKILRSTATALGQSVLLPLAKGCFVTASDLVAPDQQDRLERLIPSGMRAAAVSVTPVTSVAGFARPGSVVDVLVTGPGPDNRGVQSMTIVQRVRVLATGTQLEGALDKDRREARVVTLLVTPEEAEKLALAAQQGHIQLAIRNPADANQDPRPAVVNLAGVLPQRKQAAPKLAAPLAPEEHEITVHHGEHIEHVKLRDSTNSSGVVSPGHP